MNRKSIFIIVGSLWELLRFFLLFLFLIGGNGLTLKEGNYFLLFWGTSGFPFTFFLWIAMAKLDTVWIAKILSLGKIPALLLNFFGIGGFLLGFLPSEGDFLFLQNRLFEPQPALFFFLLILLVDFLFFINLLLLGRKGA